MTGRLFAFMDFEAKNYAAIYPDIKPGVGGVWFITWAAFNPSQAVFDPSVIRSWLAAEAKNKLRDGTSKPLIAFLLTHTAPDEKSVEGVDWTPGWLRAACPSVVVEAPVKQPDGSTKIARAIRPAYTNGFWWQCLGDAVKAFAHEIDGQAQVSFVAIAHGCDAELWPMKAPWDRITQGEVERVFATKTLELFDVYKAAFLKTPVIVNSTPGSGRKTFTQAAIKLGFGIHMCGAQTSAQNVLGWGNEMGTGNMLIDAVAAGVPAVAETTFGMGDLEFKHWTILAMLARHIDAFDVHPDWIKDVPAATWNWATSMMGVTAATAKEAWCVLRDQEYDTIQWTGSNGVISGQSDWQGNFNFFMAMRPDSNTERVRPFGPKGAIESRQCRMVKAGYFAIDAGFAPPPYTLSIRALAGPARGAMFVAFPLPGSDEVIEQRVDLYEQVDVWKTFPVVIKARQFSVTHQSGAYIHMLRAVATTVEPEPPEPPEPPAPVPDWAAMLTLVGDAEHAIELANEDRIEAEYALGIVETRLKEVTATLGKLKGELSKWE